MLLTEFWWPERVKNSCPVAVSHNDSGLSKANADLKQTPESVELPYLAAFLHYRRRESKDSMLLLSKAYKQTPDDWRIHQLFALNYITRILCHSAPLPVCGFVRMIESFARKFKLP
jgi:hypothetical protein